MPTKPPSGPRVAALVGPYLSGKTSLLESLLFAAGAIARKGTIKEANTVGDSAPAARARHMSIEVTVASTEFMGESWTFLDLPGSIEFAHEARTALMVADTAIVVAEPSVERALMLAPLLKYLDDNEIPHLIFINKIDTPGPRVRDVLASLQTVSSRPLVLRQVPIAQGDAIAGYVDLVSERAYKYQPGKPSDLIPMPKDLADPERQARQGLLETLADFDDKLLEQLVEDTVPSKEETYAHLSRNLQSNRIVPVLLGAAERDYGVRRLLKALRHEAPEAAQTMKRLGVPATGEPLAQVFKTQYAAHTGKQSIARVWRGPIADGAALGDGTVSARVGGLSRLLGTQHTKLAAAEAGATVAISRLEGVATGATLTPSGKSPAGLKPWPAAPLPLFALALQAENRTDDVKLSGALKRLAEEDAALQVQQHQDTGELLLWGQGEIHLAVAIDRLKTQYGLPVRSQRPQVPYKETIRSPINHHARHKRQSGGHGQFGDVTIEIKPRPRGAGFSFEDRIVGGAIPRNFIPSVEDGVRDYLKRGPLGFPLVDLHVALVDGSYHDVDSSDAAFKTAGALAMREAVPNCGPILLEPICKVEVSVPTEFTPRVQRLVSTRRGQILGFDAKPGWSGWDQVSAFLPQSEMADMIIELRSATLGVGTFAWTFDHLTEFTGKLADKVTQHRQEQLKAAS